MKTHYLPLLSLLGLCACTTQDDFSSPKYDSTDSVSTKLNVAPQAQRKNLAVDIFRHLAAETSGNIVFSPASVEGTLRTLKQGARGKTAAQLSIVPDTKAATKPTMAVEEANGIFLHQGLTLKPGISADDILSVEFGTDAASNAISEWVDDKTHGFISDFQSSSALDPSTQMLLVNAVYLKEKWEDPFDKGDTKTETFTGNNGKKHDVDMMHKTASMYYAKGESWQAIALPYKSGGYFIAILPKGDAHQFAANLTPQLYHSIIKAVANGHKDIELGLPSFDIRTAPSSLKSALQRCGISHIFSNKADLSGFCDAPVFATDVMQQCRIKLDEEGTEAVALSELPAWLLEDEQPQPLKLTFDRPFIWIITEANTNATPYFMGIYAHP